MEGYLVAPAISVVMPVYEPPREMLDRAIASILAQTFGDFEFLILDDGSPREETRCHLTDWASLDSRVRVFCEPHRGLTRTLNRGLRVARGEFIARQDADDWSEPERFSRQIDFLWGHPEIALAGTDAQLHRADGRALWRLTLPRTSEELAPAFIRGNPFVHGSTMFRRDLAVEIGGYREQFPCAQDYDFFWRLMERGGAVILDQVLYHYRFTAGAVSAGRAAEQAQAQRAARILARARQRGAPEDVPGALLEASMVSRSDAFRASLKQADHLMLSGNFSGARKAYFSLLQSHPGRGLAWAKVLRLAVFAAIPGAREASFR
jgi:glycosyltransferase involved in cell wall biosynthesis